MAGAEPERLEEAADGAEGLEQARRLVPDLVVSDPVQAGVFLSRLCAMSSVDVLGVDDGLTRFGLPQRVYSRLKREGVGSRTIKVQ